MINWNSSNLKLLFFENTVKRTKKQAPAWEKICPNDISDKEIVSRMDKELRRRNIKNKEKYKKCAKAENRYLTCHLPQSK